MTEFEINEFLTLKLEEKATNIYVNGRRIALCRYLLLNIPVQIESYGNINSIDEAAAIFKKSSSLSGSITPKQEFWGHCSNIQAWAEHDYDTRLLHSTLSFPLLKVLSESGDPNAKQVFKEEIVKRIEAGFQPTIIYLSNEGYLDYIDNQELRTILNNPKSKFKESTLNKLNAISAGKLKRYDTQHELINYTFLSLLFYDLDEFLTHLKELLRVKDVSPGKNITHFLIGKLWACIDAYIEHSSEESSPYDILLSYINQGKIDEIQSIDIGLVGGVLRLIRNMDHKEFAQDLVEIFLNPNYPNYIKGFPLIFLEFLGERNIIKTLFKNSFYTICNSDIESIPGIKFIEAYLGTETIKDVISKSLKSGTPEEIVQIFCGHLLDHLKQEEFKLLIETNFPVILNSLDKLPYYEKNIIFYGLIDVCEDIELMDKFFSVFLKSINNYIVFSDFVDSIMKFRLLDKYSSQIKTQLKQLFTTYQHISSLEYDSFVAILKVLREMGWIEEYFLTLFDIIDKLQDRPYRDKYKALSTLLIMAKKMGRLEEIYPLFLEMIDKPSEEEYDTFSGHLTLAKRMGWLERCFLVFLKRVYNFTTSRSKALSDLLEITIEKGWTEQIFPAFFDTLDDLNHYRKYLALYDLLKILKGTELFKQYYVRIKSLSFSLVNGLGQLPDNRKQNAYHNLNLAIKGTDLENDPMFKKMKG